MHTSPPTGLSVPWDRYTPKAVAPSDAAGLPGRSQRSGEPRPSARTSTRNGSSWILTVPPPVSPPTRSVLMVKSSGHADATHRCASASGELVAAGPDGPTGAVLALVADDADEVALPSAPSENRYTPLLSLVVSTPGARM